MSVTRSVKALAHAAESSSRCWKIGAQSAKDLDKRAVHVRVYPGVQNMSESRGLLRVLKNYGDVVYYENKRYKPVDTDPNTAVAIYQHPESAAKLISAAPFHVRYKAPPPLGPVSHPSTAGLLRMSAPAKQGSSSSNFHGQTSALDTTSTEDIEHDFYLTAELSKEDHLARFQERPYYWGYHPQTRSFAADALRKRVPEQAMSEVPTREMHPLPRRLVRKKLEKASHRRSLQDMRQDAIDEATAADVSHATSTNLRDAGEEDEGSSTESKLYPSSDLFEDEDNDD